MEDRCISCGNIIPEGRQICPVCDKVSREVLSIDEIIGHCKRQVQRFEDWYGRGYFETASLELTATKEYWEHKQVAQYLEELKRYREAEAKQASGDMRLIDAEALIEEIKTLQVFVTGLRAGKGILNEYAKQYRESILRIIGEQQTAYDTEKVVEQIRREHCGRCRNILGTLGSEEYCKEQKCQIEKLCEIVRKGGAE
ncbi:MAG: hypothetical protein IJZ23_07800 [Roseburia sp.]|nr:hypothetical protein [Roseburia sp.]